MYQKALERWKQIYMTLPLTITCEIIDKLSPSKSLKEFKKYKTCSINLWHVNFIGNINSTTMETTKNCYIGNIPNPSKELLT